MSDRHFEFRPRKVPAGLRPRDLDRVDLPDDDAEPTPAHPQPVDYGEEGEADALARLRHAVVALADWLSACGPCTHETVTVAGALRAACAGRSLPEHIRRDLAQRARFIEDRRAAHREKYYGRGRRKSP